MADMKKLYDFDEISVQYCVNKNRPGPILATYHLLLQKRMSEKKNCYLYGENKKGSDGDKGSEKAARAEKNNVTVTPEIQAADLECAGKLLFILCFYVRSRVNIKNKGFRSTLNFYV